MSVVYHALFRPTEMPSPPLWPRNRAAKSIGALKRSRRKSSSIDGPNISRLSAIARSSARKTVNKIMKCFRGNRHDITRMCKGSRVRKPIDCVADRRRLRARAGGRCSFADFRRRASPCDSTRRSRGRPIVPRATPAERHHHAQTEDSAPSATAQGPDRATHRVTFVVQ